MTTYGVTTAGFVKKPLQQIIADANARILSTVNAELDLDPDQPPGQVIGILADAFAQGWELAQVAYNATNRADAEGPLLDNIGGLTGTPRAKQRPSFVPCTAVFKATGTYAAGALVGFVTGYPSARFTNVAAIVVGAYGDDGSAIGPAHPKSVSTLFKSLDQGPDSGNALLTANGAGHGQLNQIVPVTGWVSLADVGTVSLGALVEEDPPFRQRQKDELGAAGNDTLDATRAAILRALAAATPPVPTATVQMYENRKLVFDPVTELPGKTYMAVVYDGVSPPAGNDAIIANAIWANKAGASRPYGSTTVNVVDSEGTTRTVGFTRATPVPVALAMDVYVDAGMSGPDRTALANAVRTALVDASQGSPFSLFGSTVTPTETSLSTLRPGRDFVASVFRAIAQGQPGVLDLQNFVVTSPTPDLATGNVAIGIGEFAQLDPLTIVITPHDFVI
jgi:hypothetical protein